MNLALLAVASPTQPPSCLVSLYEKLISLIGGKFAFCSSQNRFSSLVRRK